MTEEGEEGEEEEEAEEDMTRRRFLLWGRGKWENKKGEDELEGR